MVDDLTTQLLEPFEASNDGRLLLGGVGKLEQDGLSRACTTTSEDRVEIMILGDHGRWLSDLGTFAASLFCSCDCSKVTGKYQLTLWSRRVEYCIQTIKVLQ